MKTYWHLLFSLTLLFSVWGSFPSQLVYAGGIAPIAAGTTRMAGGITRYVATTGTDSGDCSNSSSPCLTLEYAYSQAVSDDIISVAAGTYTTLSEIDLTRSLTLTGAGAFSTIIQAAASAGTANHRLFKANTDTTVVIENMTLRYGVEASGGAIHVVSSTLTLNSVIVSENQVTNTTGSAGLNGGAIFINAGTLTLNNSAVISNSVTTTDTATTRGNGGGIFVEGGTVNLNNSTVSGNAALRGGGGLYANGGTLNLKYSTVANNTSDSDNDTVGDGGGLQRNAGTLNLQSSLVVGNKKGPTTHSDCAGTLTSQGYNLTGASTGCAIASTGDSSVAPATVFTNVLRALADNGGNTWTHALFTNSVAINRTPYGTLGCGTTYAVDQRGSARWQGGLCDSGAYETAVTSSCYAETTGDNLPDYASNDAGAVQAAATAATAGGTVKIAGYCAGVTTLGGSTQTVLLTKTLTLGGGYTLTNWTTAYPLTQPTTLDALGSGRVIQANVTATVQGFTVTNGFFNAGTTPSAPAGGIYAVSDLTLLDMVVYRNTITGTSTQGGGVWVGGIASLSNTLIMDNVARSTGGGARFNTQVYLTNTIFSGNQANGGGGAYFNAGAALWGVTFRANTARSGVGGGATFISSSNVVTMVDAIFDSNQASGNGGGATINSAVTISGAVFSQNLSLGGGGALYFQNATPKRLVNVLFSRNQAQTLGAALNVNNATPLQLLHVTIVSPTAPTSSPQAIYVAAGTVYLTNTLIASHTVGIDNGAGLVSEWHGLYSAVTTPYTGSVNVNGSIMGTAAFANTTDYQLSAASDAINAGVLPTPDITTDYFGDPRPQQGGYDIGYDETSFVSYATLTVATAGNGNGIVTPTVGTYTYTYGSVVTLTAAANTGSTFSGWVPSTGSGCSGTGSCVVTITGNQSVTATFTLNTYTLTVATAGNGSGSVTPTVGVYTYTYGSVVTLTATANTGSTFSGWGASGGTACPGTGSCVVTITGNQSVTATFVTNKLYLPFIGK